MVLHPPSPAVKERIFNSFHDEFELNFLQIFFNVIE